MKAGKRFLRRRPLIESLETRRLLSAATSALSADASQLVFGDVVGGAPSASRTVTFSNTGAAPVTIAADGISIAGDAATSFHFVTAPPAGAVLAPGESLALTLNFEASALGPQGATLQLTTDDATNPLTTVTLRGLGTQGEQGSLEPSLQWILDTYQISSRTGDLDPAESTLDLVPLPNDEVIAPLFTKAGLGPVTVTPIAVYSNVASPALTLGYYTKSSPTAGITKKMLYTVPSADVQTLNPHVNGTSTFDPGLATFGLYSTWAAQNNRTVYSEDFRNTFISTPSLQRMFKAYPLTNPDGTVVANAYVIGNEEATNHDYQDAVYIMRNVTPAQGFPATVPQPSVSGLVLVNADTSKDIGPLVNGQLIDLSQIGTSHLSVRAVLNATPGSVKFIDGSFVHVENAAPYTINGDGVGPGGTTYTAWSAPLGTSTLTVTPFSSANAAGTIGGAMSVSFTVVLTTPIPPTPPPPPPPVVVPPPVLSGLTLVKSGTAGDIGALVDQATLDLTQIGSSLNVRADGNGSVASVSFVYDASPIGSDTATPFLLAGDTAGAANAWTPTLGAHTLTVTPYDLAGVAGTAITVNFTIISSPLPPPPPPPPPPPAPVVYEAENATLSGALAAKDNAGYTGTGYADFQNASGDSIRWNVSALAAGSVTLTFRYANGGTTNRALALRVNGVMINPSLAFNSTGSWTTWKTVSVTVQLIAGANSIVLATTGSNGANFDSMTVG